MKKIDQSIDKEKELTIKGALGFSSINNFTHINIDNILAERCEYAKRFNENPELAIESIKNCNNRLKNLLGIN